MDKSTPKTRYVKDFPIIKRPDQVDLGYGFTAIGPWETATLRFCIDIYKDGEHWYSVFGPDERTVKSRFANVLLGLKIL